MTRRELVLAVLSAAGGESHTPVQVQKLFFLLDRKIPGHIGGPYFHFQPFDYGPFDPDVYREIERLQPAMVVVEESPTLRMKHYRLTAQGQSEGEAQLSKLDASVADYVRQLSYWVRSQSFASLVSAIYREFPDMKVNSVFNG